MSKNFDETVLGPPTSFRATHHRSGHCQEEINNSEPIVTGRIGEEKG